MPERSFHGGLTNCGRDYIFSVLPEMDKAGLQWLTPIVNGMAMGDPWQEGISALDIVEAWSTATAASSQT